MIKTNTLMKLGEELLLDAYKAFEKQHGYDPRDSSDRLKFESVSSFLVGIVPTFEFYYLEVTPHDCPYCVSLCISEKELKELAEIVDLETTCSFCEKVNKLHRYNDVKLDTAMYLNRSGIICNNDEYVYNTYIKWNYCPECGIKLDL